MPTDPDILVTTPCNTPNVLQRTHSPCQNDMLIKGSASERHLKKQKGRQRRPLKNTWGNLLQDTQWPEDTSKLAEVLNGLSMLRLGFCAQVSSTGEIPFRGDATAQRHW